jgi:hypothetical protein
VAEFNTVSGQAVLFQAVPATHAHGSVCLSELQAGLAGLGLTAATVSQPDTTTLFAGDTPDGPLYVMLSEEGLCGVHGLGTLEDARALIARWLAQ